MSSQDSPQSKVQTGGEALADALIANGVNTVFGIPGIQLDPVFDALLAELGTGQESRDEFLADGRQARVGEQRPGLDSCTDARSAKHLGFGSPSALAG